jgi:endonuclease/exonuclease/phosphatase family metal-dependent hydrolase
MFLLAAGATHALAASSAPGHEPAENPHPAASTQPASDVITVMTYNIHHAAGADKKVDVERIARVIRSCEADLVALQEVQRGGKRVHDLDEPAELGKLTGMYHAFGETMPWDTTGQYGDAILSRFPIISSRVVKLPWTPGNHREQRILLEVICKTPKGEIAFFSTHLDHTGHSPDRLPQAKAIVEATKDLKHPAILGGDFNCPPQSKPVKEIETIWTIASDRDPSPTCPADHPKGKIDHIFVKPADRWHILSAKVIDEREASDHRPVVVKVEMRGQD